MSIVFSFSWDHFNSQEKLRRQCLCKILGWQTKSIMVCYDILWSGQLVLTILGDPGAVSRIRRKGGTKVFKYGRKSPWVPTLTELFPRIQADTGSWLGTKNSLYYCAQSANSLSWVLFVSLYTTAIVSIRACRAHAPKKCTQSGDFQFDIKSPSDFCPETKDTFPKIQAWAYNRYSHLHRSRLA